MSLLLYSIAWWLASPLAIVHLLWRARLQPEYRSNWAQRWGFDRTAAARRGSGPLLWVHAVSVGETRAAQPLVAALLERHPDARLLLTHMTPTGRATGAELFARYGERVQQAWLPYDLGFAARRFLRAWRPALGIVMETELWPNLCEHARRQGVPLALVNARLSERSLRKGLRWRRLMTPALRSLACVVAQTPADAQRIERLGRPEVAVAGNMKFDVTPAPALVGRGEAWKALLRGRPAVLAASTRDGEEALLLDAWQARAPRALLVLVPRHPQRFDEVAAELARRGLRFARRAALDDGAGFDAGAIDVLLGDSMGEMFAWDAMADVAVLGGSLLPFGGQNLIEACALGVPVVMGEHTFNFQDAAAQAIDAGAAVRAAGAGEALGQALALLGDDERRGLMGARARAFAQAHRGATARTLALMAPWLPRPRG
jgi:3-deoxy-D-manno-octulosonic-acid transferase